MKGFAHITGGGLTENIPRVLPDGLGVTLDANAWELSPVFRWMAGVGSLPAAELARTLHATAAVRSAKKAALPVRIQIDPAELL